MIKYVRHQLATTKHKFWVMWYLVKACGVLLKRGLVHDLSKYGKIEEPYFRKTWLKLKYLTYGSEEYKKALQELEPALKHHYEVNSHHPEHYGKGYANMSVFDKVELICDWKAATRRHINGDIGKSIYSNADRFKYDRIEIDNLLRAAEELNILLREMK